MVKREKLKAKFNQVYEEETKKSVILLSSSDDEEANEDLSLEIVERARIQEAKRKRDEGFDEFKASDGVRSVSVIDLASSSSEELEVVTDLSGGFVAPPEEMKKDQKKKKKKKSKKIEKEEKTVDVADREEKEETVAFVETEAIGVVETEEPMDTIKSVETTKPPEAEEVNISDNIVLRKLLRGPRYFNPPDSNWGTCYNCGEEGHMAVNCTSKKRKKPCFVCGSFEHIVKNCTQGKDCFICKRRGHRAKDCPEKQLGSYQNTSICLRCGYSGHDMFSCPGNYAHEDLKEIQCYVCKGFGHLCCGAFIAMGPAEVSCYNCGQSGHTGLGCAKPRGETSGAVSTPLCCYKCGEEGHFARGCTTYAKHDSRMSEYSTPTKRFSKKVSDTLGYRSAPHDLGKARKKKSTHYDEKEFVTPVKSKQRGGWITDDPGDLPKVWRSSATPTKKFHKSFSSTTGGHVSNSRSPWKKPNPFPATPSSHGSANNHYQQRFSASRNGNFSDNGSANNHYQHRFSASRDGNFSGGGYKRTYYE